jgi:hypothetical protein
MTSMKIKGRVQAKVRKGLFVASGVPSALVIISVLFGGCFAKHKFTAKVCNGKLYSEVYNINPAGVDEDYLTDSSTFRIFIGKFDSDHENFSYVCSGDSIKVLKLATDTSGERMKLVDSRVLSLSELKMNKFPKQQPLFEFK